MEPKSLSAHADTALSGDPGYCLITAAGGAPLAAPA